MKRLEEAFDLVGGDDRAGIAKAVAGLFSLIVTRWASPLDRANMDRFGDFDWRGIVPIGHAAFAFVLGITIGIVARRMLPAMATTLVAFVAIRLAFIHLIRPRLISPLQPGGANLSRVPAP